MTQTEISKFEYLNSQIESAYDEISSLTKKNPDGVANTFKIQIINLLLGQANALLPTAPIDGFTQFDPELLPTYSDAALILSQYLSRLEQLRTDNIIQDEYNPSIWYWNIKDINIKTKAPKKLQRS